MLRTLRKVLNYYVPLWDFCYILQLEEYDLQRYLKQVWLRLFRRNFEVRDSLRYTTRIKLTLLMTLCFLAPLTSTVVGLFLVPILTPFAIAAASLLISVPVAWQKQQRLRTAHHFFKQHHPNTKVIAITGSFGKTTTKYLLQHVLQYDYRTAIIPDNLNTSLGIANYILEGNIPKNCDLLIVEMGAYERGDIAESTSVTPPDYAIITIFGDQHLERFGSYRDIVLGKSEICTTHDKTMCYLSEADQTKAAQEGLSTDQLITVSVPEGAKTTNYLVAKLAQDLGVSEQSVEKSLSTFTPPERRNNLIEREGVTIIDNSYNISPMVAEAMIVEAAETAKRGGKQLVVMTGGIGEQGELGPAANQTLAKLLNNHATRVIVNDTIFASDVISDLSIPYEVVRLRTEVTDNPSNWLNGETEILLWLTGHGDLAYL